MGRRGSNMRLIFVRHGKDDDRYRGGWSSLGLTKEGREQARCLGAYLAKDPPHSIKWILSSDLNRAVETAEILSASLGLPITLEPQLREMDNGDLAGMLNEEALDKYPGLFFNTLEMEEPYPNGESPVDFYQRIRKWFEMTLKESEKQEGDLLVVTHGGVINVIYHLVKGWEWSNRKPSIPIKNCSVHILDCGKMKMEEAVK